MLLNCGVGEDSWESLGLQGDETRQSSRKLVLNIYWKDWYWNWIEAPILLLPDAKSQLIRKDPYAGKDWRQEEKRMTEDEKVQRHHQLNGHEFEPAPGDGDGQENLVCCNPWGHKESYMTELMNNKSCNVWPLLQTFFIYPVFKFHPCSNTFSPLPPPLLFAHATWCRILVPRPGMKPVPPEVEVQSPN